MPPEIRLLADLSETPGRLQHYANFVRYLCFDIEDLDGSQYGYDPEDDSRDEARFHTLFCNYLQRNLKGFIGFGKKGIGGVLSDEFFCTIKNRCPSLTSLKLALDTDCSYSTELVSRKGFVEFLADMQSLSHLKIRYGFDEVMSSEALAHIARYQFLSTLSLPDMAEQWVIDLDRGSTSAVELFPSLRTFKAGLSDTGVRLLLRHLPNIGRLVIRPFELAEQSFHIIAEAQLTTLYSLTLNFDHDSVVYGTDLLLLAEYAKKLEYLDLPPPEKDSDYIDYLVYPHARGITDEVIDELARRLPLLAMLDLNTRETNLTEASLISLGTYCKRLSRLSLSVNASFEGFARKGHPDLFPALEDWTLGQPDTNRRPHSNLRQIAEWICQMMPNLNSVDLVDIHGNWPRGGSDREMGDAIIEILRAVGR
ncbi:hypothetical protein MMC18_009539 [Xylographa bjoerkii]|nr:hypothetical protein [Xylographa bjoerkii]